MRYLILFLLPLFLFSQEFKVASYNVENLFDVTYHGDEYKEYIPNRHHWTERIQKKKLTHIAEVICDVDADIIGLQEVENDAVLEALQKVLQKVGCDYRYRAIADQKETTIHVALLSRFPIKRSAEVRVNYSSKDRNILEVLLDVDGYRLTVFVNHWKSKSGPESMRIVSAKKVLKRTEELGLDKNIIVLGDFNSHYEEYILFKRKRKHNDTDGETGINHILGTIDYNKVSTETNLAQGEFYNLWYDINEEDRYSYIYRGKKEALDNILISPSLLNTQGIHYKTNSISSYKEKYLFSGKSINRWKMSRKKPKVHKGKGYSDHLAVIAKFVVN